MSSAWQKIYHEEFGEYYYYNASTQETTWVEPEGMTAAAPEPVVPALNLSLINPADVWTEAYDANGQKYYYNAAGEVSWEPKGVVASEPEPHPDAAPAAAPVAVEPLPDGWVEYVHEETNLPYYHHLATDHIQWDRPQPSPSAVAPAITLAVLAAQPDGEWITHTHESGQLYYEHSVTHATQWDKPEGLSPSGSIKGHQASGAAAAAASTHTVTELAIATTEPADALNMSLFSASGLLADAAAGKSPNRNKMSSFVAPPSDFSMDNLPSPKSTEEGIYGIAQQEAEMAAALDAINGINYSDPLSVTATMLSIPSTQHSSLQCMMTLGGKLLEHGFNLYKYAEQHFLYDTKLFNTNNNILHKLISNQSESLSTALTLHLPQQYAPIALDCFALVQAFMTTSPLAPAATKPYDIIYKLLYKLITIGKQELHDEVLVQVMKQIKSNSSLEQVELGWQLILVLLSCIPPSKMLFPYLTAFIYQYLQHHSATGTGSANIKRFITNCLQIVLLSTTQKMRKEIPTEKEVTILLLNELYSITIYTIDYSAVRVNINSFTSTTTLLATIQTKLRIVEENQRCFGLFQCKAGHNMLLNQSERVVDVLSRWEKHSRNNETAAISSPSPTFGSHPEEESIQDKYHFLFKVHIYLPIANDGVSEGLLFKQCVYSVLQAAMPMSLQDYIFLNALYLQHTFGDYISGKDYNIHYCLTGQQHVLSPYIASLLDRSDAVMTKSELEHKTILLYKKLMGISKHQSMMMYICFQQSNRLFGAAYYRIQTNNMYASNNTQSSTQTNSDHLLLAITFKSVILIDQQTSTYLAEYFYSNIYSYTHSFDAFILVIGNKASHTKHYFQTTQGQEMEELLNIYSSYHQKSAPVPVAPGSQSTPHAPARKESISQ